MELVAVGEYKDAEKVLRECLRRANTGVGASDLGSVGAGGDTQQRDAIKFKALSAMAELDRTQGNYEAAKELYLEALKTARKMESDDGDGNGSNRQPSPQDADVDASIINSIAGYAEILRKGGDLRQAEALHKKVLNMLLTAEAKIKKERDAKRKERERGAAKNRMGRIRGRCNEISVESESIISGIGKRLRGISRDNAEQIAECATSSDGSDKDDAAEEEEADEADKRVEHELDLRVAVSNTQLGCTYFGMKRYDDALLHHKSALSIRIKRLEFTDACLSESLNYCAETLCATGRGADALPMSLHAVEVRKMEFGTSHPAYAHALSVLAGCYHGAGRSADARPLADECLRICEVAFSNENHANLVPNLVVRGDIFRALGERDDALGSYRRAEAIHLSNFKEGQMDGQLEECRKKIEATEMLKRQRFDSIGRSEELDDAANGLNGNTSNITTASTEPSDWSNICQTIKRSNRRGTPVIIITDIGRNVDDTIALAILASLTQMCIIDPLAVIATLSPQTERACLARVTLDSLGLHDVPVGIGTDGNATDGDAAIEFSYFRGNMCPPSSSQRNIHHPELPFRLERGLDLMTRVLEGVDKPRSVKLLCLASLKDAAELIRERGDLFREKIQEVVLMGGLDIDEISSHNEEPRLVPDVEAYNNRVDVSAARYVYAAGIPTTTVTEFAAYGCPFSCEILDELRETHHLLAVDIRNANLLARNKLWSAVNLPADDPERKGLPARCDRAWFVNRFLDKDVGDNEDGDNDDGGGGGGGKNGKRRESDEEINESLGSCIYMSDPLAMLHCVDAYRELHFYSKAYKIDGVVHRITGVSETENGIVNSESLAMEIHELLIQAFRSLLYDVLNTNSRNLKDFSRNGSTSEETLDSSENNRR